MQYYPDTTLPRAASPQKANEPIQAQVKCALWGAQGFWRKEKRKGRFEGFMRLSLRLLKLNQPNAKSMPLFTVSAISPVYSQVSQKQPESHKKNHFLATLRKYSPCQHLHRNASNAPESPAYMPHVTRAYAIPHNAPCNPHITRLSVTLHNPCGTNLYHLHKALDSSCYGLGSDPN